MLDRAVGNDLDVAPDLDEAGKVLGVDHQQTDTWVGTQVATLLALERRVDAGALTTDINPNEARLRLAVDPDGREDSADRSSEQVEMRDRNGDRLGADEGRQCEPPRRLASRATTWFGRIRQRTGNSISAKRDG